LVLEHRAGRNPPKRPYSVVGAAHRQQQKVAGVCVLASQVDDRSTDTALTASKAASRLATECLAQAMKHRRAQSLLASDNR